MQHHQPAHHRLGLELLPARRGRAAIETAAEDLTIRYDLHKDVPLRGPLGETRSTWIVIGFGANLDDALVACLRETIHWLAAAAQIAESEAYALASMAVSFRVTQYGVTLSAADRLDILDVVGRADAAATRRDADAYTGLFTDDAVLDGSQGTHPAAVLRSSVGPIWAAEGPATLHPTLNPVIDPGDAPDEAVVRSILLIVSPAQPITIHTAAAITQTLRRTGDNWRISKRTVAEYA